MLINGFYALMLGLGAGKCAGEGGVVAGNHPFPACCFAAAAGQVGFVIYQKHCYFLLFCVYRDDASVSRSVAGLFCFCDTEFCFADFYFFGVCDYGRNVSLGE